MTMNLIVSDSSPSGPSLAVNSHGQYCLINTAAPYSQWNKYTFQLLNIPYRITVTDAPSITIAK